MASVIEADDRNYGFSRERGRANRSLLPDPKYLMMVFRRRLWLFVAAAALVLTAVVVALKLATPAYTATARVLIEPRKNDAIDLQSVVQGLPADTNVVDTETQIIASPTTALAVVRRLKLDADPEFVSDQVAAAPAASGQRGVTARERAAASAVLGRVFVKRAGLTYVIDITAKSKDAAKSAAIANAFATEFIAIQMAHRAGVSENAADFVSRRAVDLRKQAVADDAAVQRYMIANNLMSAQGATMAEQEVSTLNQQIAEAESRLAQERG